MAPIGIALQVGPSRRKGHTMGGQFQMGQPPQVQLLDRVRDACEQRQDLSGIPFLLSSRAVVSMPPSPVVRFFVA